MFIVCLKIKKRKKNYAKEIIYRKNEAVLMESYEHKISKDVYS